MDFRWSQLESSKNYQTYIANLRAVGCPEATIADIVKGDTERTFAWERNQLGLSETGNGPWSRQAEMRLVAHLLGEPTVTETATLGQNWGNVTVTENNGHEVTRPTVAADSPASHRLAAGNGQIAALSSPSSAETGVPAFPSFRQNANWSASGLTADQPAAKASPQPQYQSAPGDSNPNNPVNQSLGPPPQAPDAPPTDPNSSAPFPSAQERMQKELYQYYVWYQPQVIAATAEGVPLIINPNAAP